MHKNIGILKEEELIKQLNGKKICELSNNLKFLIREMYGSLDDDDIVSAIKIEEFIKPDFIISVKGNKHFVSMKSGTSNVVHQENIKKFCIYLREQGVSNRTLQTILLYQYGDGTLDGSGKERYHYEKLRYLLSARIKEANQELNSNKKLVLNVIERCIFQGTNPDYQPADYIYHGDKDYGVIVSKTQMIKHCQRRDWAYMINLHIGPIQVRPHARYVNKEIKNPESREKVECYWCNYYADLDYISSRYNG